MTYAIRASLLPALLASIALPMPAAADISFTGLTEETETNARALMDLAVAACSIPEWRARRLFRDADEQLQEALEALGYYRFSFEKSLSFDSPECWHAKFDVQLGQPVTIRSVDVVVNGAALTDENIQNRFTSQRPVAGSTLNHGVYESFKKAVLSRLFSRGFFNAELTETSVLVDETLTHADIVIRAESGERFRFGDISFSKGILSDELLNAYPKFRKGDFYDAEAIAELHKTMGGSGYFDSVSIRAEPVAGNGEEVPVFVTLKPAKRRVYTVGAGYATDTGIQGRLGYTNRRRNMSGHQFDARLHLSQVTSDITGTYRWPRGRPDAEWVDVYGGYQQKRTDTSRSDKTTIGIRVARNRTKEWLETPYVDFTQEDFTVADQLDRSRLITPGIKWETTVGREFGRIPTGRRISFDVHGASGQLWSDASFLQATASAKWVASFGDRTRTLLRIDVGSTLISELDELPATERFFAGGDNSVRGYSFETIGPVDDNGDVTGGENLVVVSLEADWLIAKNWAIATFVDSGSAFNDTNIQMKSGIGAGIRWYSPLGPIRIDLAHPLDDPETSVRLHITLGPDL